MKTLARVAVFLLLGIGYAFGQSDNFNYTGSLSANWTVYSGAFTANGSGISASGSAFDIAFYNGTFASDQYSCTTLATYSGAGTVTLGAVRGVDGNSGYLVLFDGTFQLWNGQTSEITSLSGTVTVGHEYCTLASGSTITFKDETTGTTILTGTDSTYTSGNPGIGNWGTSSSVTSFWRGGNGVPPPQASVPSFSPAGPRLPTGGGTITITCSSSGTVAHYTTDGSTPTSASTSSSTVSVTTAKTLKALCSGTGYIDSSVTTANYTVGSLTFYVRPDGGTRYSTAGPVATGGTSAGNTAGQCDGLADAPYPGSGVNQHCAFNDVRWAYDDQHTYGYSNWALAGGDTLQLSHSYPSGLTGWPIGFDSPTSSAWCSGQSGAHFCGMPAPPSGTPSNPTRILGANWQNCSISTTILRPLTGGLLTIDQPDPAKTTQIYGDFNLDTTIDMSGAHDIVIGCLELTSHNGQCLTHGLDFSGQVPTGYHNCTSSDHNVNRATYTNYLSYNITLQDVDMHGFTSEGMRGMFGGPSDPSGGIPGTMTHFGDGSDRLASVYLNRVRIAGNVGAGWDMSHGDTEPNNPPNSNLVANNVLIEWNGFLEQYPRVDTYPYLLGFTQGTNSFDADGIASQADASFSASFNHIVSRYNTEDGLDMGHIEHGTSTNTIQLLDSMMYGNMAGVWKYGSRATTVYVADTVLVDNCYRMKSAFAGLPSTFTGYFADYCRAGDNTGGGYLSGSNISYLNNTMVFGINTGFDWSCNTVSGSDFASICSGAHVTVENNLIVGVSDQNCITDGNGACSYSGNGKPAAFYWAYKQGCCSTIEERSGDPDPAVGVIFTHKNNLYYNLRNTGTADPSELFADPLFNNEPAFASFTNESLLDQFDPSLVAGSPAKIAGVAGTGVTTDIYGSGRPTQPTLGAIEMVVAFLRGIHFSGVHLSHLNINR